MTQPTIGRIVHYRLSASDAEDMNRRREHAIKDFNFRSEHPIGTQIHYGKPLDEGDVFPAMIVKVDDPDEDKISLQVFLDGTDILWIKWAPAGTAPGQWHWPVRSPNA